MPGRQLSTKPPRIGGPLRALLYERCLTHEEFAREIGVSVSTVSRWCRNETPPSKRRLRQVAEHLGVEPRALIERAGDDDSVAA